MLYVMKTSVWEAIFNFRLEVGYSVAPALLFGSFLSFWLYFFLLLLLLGDSLFVSLSRLISALWT